MIGASRSSARWIVSWLIGLILASDSPADDRKPKAALDRDATITHPIIPGFERFADDPKADRVRGGLLLLGELNCVSCHTGRKESDEILTRKQAPILDQVAARVRPGYIGEFLADPQGTKPGTTMPDVLAALPKEQKKAAAEALTHFLAATGGLTDSAPIRRAIELGEKLYHQAGCVACHGPRKGSGARLATSVPLGDLDGKYSVASLGAFLADPLKVRPSGRMPALNLNAEEARNIASYLLKDLRTDSAPNLNYRYFEGAWDKLPDFSELKPEAEGQATGFDIDVKRRDDNIALVFEGFLELKSAGEYTFHLTSDDGSKLLIDGELVVNNDGIHPSQSMSDKVELIKGMHRIEVAYFNAAGELSLEVEYEGRGLSRRPVSTAVYLTEQGETAAVASSPGQHFKTDPELAEKGRELFVKVGCASCHQLREQGKAIATELAARPLDKLRAEAGCLAPDHADGTPSYPLDDRQRESLSAAIAFLSQAKPTTPDPREVVSRTLTTFNCHACHQRDGVGGVEEGRDEYFATTQKEMGDEGRIPPSLNGVGAKLEPGYLKKVIAEGSKDRPYMLTRMPRFGAGNVADAASAFGALDPIEPVETPSFDEPVKKVKSTGRFLAGGMALGCIKCHTFKGIKAEGVQAIDMTIMTRRLKHEWFHRYLIDPQAYRPGTRMPGAWPLGKSLLPKVLDGDTPKQIEAIWQFLSDGNNATEPYGLGSEPMPLVAETEPILYRNFIKGGGSRAIGVGYPERANLAFDANDVRLALIWQGDFIDASRHWSGRGEGFQSPLGDNVLELPPGPGFATLKSLTDDWPTQKPKELGYRFRGYRLDGSLRPTFLYQIGSVQVEDFPEAIKTNPASTLRRTLTLASDKPIHDLYFRAAIGARIEPTADGWYTIDGEWKIRIESDPKPIVRQSRGKIELLVPIDTDARTARIVEQFVW